MLVLDLETLDVESTAVILSASIVEFTEGDTWDTLLNKALFVKFDAKEQTRDFKRTVSRETLDWWQNQSDEVRKVSLLPSSNDVSASEGIQLIKDYIEKYDTSSQPIVWARSGFDFMVICSLCNAMNVPHVVKHSRFRDIRTAVDILASNSNGGYCDVNLPGFDKSVVQKHNPIHDICYDALQLLYPN